MVPGSVIQSSARQSSSCHSGSRCFLGSEQRSVSRAPICGRSQTRLSFSERCVSTGASLPEANSVVSPSSSDATSPADEYTQLRQKLLSRAKKGSGFLAVYIFLQQGLVATSCSLLGSFAGYVYLKSLLQTVENYTGDSEVPLVSAQQISSQPWRALSIVLAVYRQALSARLLIPLSLAAGITVFNAAQSQNFTLLQEFDILLGFLFSYKSGLVLALYDDIKPKARSEDDVRAEKPSLAALADLEEDRQVRLLGERQRR